MDVGGIHRSDPAMAALWRQPVTDDAAVAKGLQTTQAGSGSCRARIVTCDRWFVVGLAQAANMIRHRRVSHVWYMWRDHSAAEASPT